MIVIDRHELFNAFRLPGWLDIESGRIMTFKGQESDDGIYRFELPADVLSNATRYIRVPFACDIAVLIASIKHQNIEDSVLDQYGIRIQDFEGGNLIRQPPYVEHVQYTKSEIDFLNRIHEMEEDLELDDTDFEDEFVIRIIEDWCKARGYLLSGTWHPDFDLEAFFAEIERKRGKK